MILFDKIVSFVRKKFNIKSNSMEETERHSNVVPDADVTLTGIDQSNSVDSVNTDSDNGILEEQKINTSDTSITAADKPVIVDASVVSRLEEQDKAFLSTFRTLNNGYIIGLSLRGRAHELHGTSCQDYHCYEEISSGWHILSVSDGAGSAKFASRGSKANSTFAIRLVKEMLNKTKWVENDYFPTELEWYIESRSIFERIKLIIRTKVSELEEACVENDFNATLLLAIITPKGVLAAHIGDGRMGYLSENDEWKSMMTPHKGAEANQTMFLQGPWTRPSVPAFKLNGVFVPEVFVITERPKAVVLISDGCERLSWECSIRNDVSGRYVDRNLPYRGFMSPLLDALNETSDNDKLELFQNILDCGTSACERELDDKTMLLAVLI